MEEQYDSDTNYEGRVIMISGKKENNFYRVTGSTEKMFCIRKIKCETRIVREDEDGIVYEAKIGEEYEEETRKIIKKNIVKYPWIYCIIIQYEK